MIEKIVRIEWSLKIETSIADYNFHAVPICMLTIHFENGETKELRIQIADKVLLIDHPLHDFPMDVINKIIDRVQKPLQKEVDKLMMRIEKVTNYGSFKKEFWNQFWVENAMGK